MTNSQRKGKPARKGHENGQTFSDTSDFRNLNVADLLEPAHAARMSFDDQKLYELIESIKAQGVLMPLLVEPEGNRFRVHAGHRRLVAVRAIGMTTVPCRVFKTGTCQGEALKHHENKFREDLNAAEQARHFAMLLDKFCGGDTDRLCDLVQERREYVEERLNLITGDERVFQALTDAVISIGVAKELNRVKDPASRMMFLDSAMTNGASVRMVRDWRVRINAQDEIAAGLVMPDNPTDYKPATGTDGLYMRCYICESGEDAHELEILYVHRSCAKAVQRMAQHDAATGAKSEEQV